MCLFVMELNSLIDKIWYRNTQSIQHDNDNDWTVYPHEIDIELNVYAYYDV